MDRNREILARIGGFVFDTWYVAGAVGWFLIYYKYPLAVVLPRYAGG